MLPADLDGYPELDLLSRALSFSSPSLRVSTRIEAYSCKPIARERKLFKAIEHDLLDNLSLSTSISPPEHHSDLVASAFGPLDRKDSRKTFWLLIATLNIAFPDHDFSTLSAEEFVREDSPRIVLASLTSALSQIRSSNGQDGPPAMPLALGMPISDPYQKTYSSSAPASHSSMRKANDQKSQSKSNTAKQGKNQSKGQQVKAGSSSNGSKAQGEGIMTTEEATSNDTESHDSNQAATDLSKRSISAAKKASEHQPRAKPKVSSTTHHTTSSSLSSKKKQAPISHTTLIAKLRNELDGTYEVPTHPLLRQVLDPIIDLSECDVYSYTPDLDSDPHAYQSEDEEEEDIDEDEEDDMEEYERQSDGLDMDLEDDEYYRPAGMSSMDIGRMSWDMEGVESTPATSVPGTPSAGLQSQRNSTFTEAQASPLGGQSSASQSQGKKSAQKKRSNAGGANSGNAKRPSRSSKAGSGVRGNAPSASSSRTTIVPGSSIFGDSQSRGGSFQYGSLDEQSYNQHQIPQQREHSPSSRRSPLHEGMSSNDGTDEDDGNDDDDTDNGGLLWSSNYFFYNRKMKRILFVSVWGRKIGNQFSPSNALLARSAGNPLHAYRRQLNASMAVKTGRDGRVTINLDRPRAGSNLALPPSMPPSGGSNENGQSGLSYSGNQKNATSNLTTSLRANADAAILNTSFSSQPPIANAASVFKPSSPFPRGDNRPSTAPGTPSSLNPRRSGGGDDPQPPVIRDSAAVPQDGASGQAPAAASPRRSEGNNTPTTRVRQRSSGAITRSKKTARKN